MTEPRPARACREKARPRPALDLSGSELKLALGALLGFAYSVGFLAISRASAHSAALPPVQASAAPAPAPAPATARAAAPSAWQAPVAAARPARPRGAGRVRTRSS